MNEDQVIRQITAILFFVVISKTKSDFINWTVKSLHNHLIKSHIFFTKKIEELKLDKKQYSPELNNLILFNEIRNKLYFLTKTIGWAESILFTGATILFFKIKEGNIGPTIEPLLLLTAGWLGLKIVGNYKNWEGIITGRFFFYTFLIGTIANIVFSIIIGFIINIILIQ